MRRFPLAFAILAALAPVFACGGEEAPPAAPAPPPPPPPPATTQAPPADPPPAPKPSMADMEKAAIQDALKGLNGQDPKKFASVYADDGVISVAGLNEISGRPAIQQNMTEWFDTFKNVKLGFERVWVKGDTL